MPPERNKWLYDIQQAAKAILVHAPELTVAQFEEDIVIRSFIERQFEIIGEAMRRLIQADPELARQVTHHRQIIDFRNVLAHGYDSIDAAVVVQIVGGHLGVLLTEVERLLEAPGPPTAGDA